jgi:Fe2+ or Zn2+ uptake regulation protein
MMELVHASAEDVQILLFQRGTPVNTTTVYNILSQLADEHIYNRRLSGNNIMYFDVDPRRHLHLYDRENHLFRNVEDEQLSALVAAQLKRHKFRGYTIEDLDIQIIVKPTRKKKKP